MITGEMEELLEGKINKVKNKNKNRNAGFSKQRSFNVTKKLPIEPGRRITKPSQRLIDELT